jgi:hypothetical protein
MSPDSATATPDAQRRAREIVGWYTLAATGTGAVPLPAASVAIIANNGFMLAHVGATMGSVVTWEGVVASLGIAGTLNVAGRTVFVEAGKALSWGTGSLWALAGLCAAGATTAGLQTYILGLIAIEMCQNGGRPLDSNQAAQIIATAKETLGDFISEMKHANPANPGLPPTEAQAMLESATPPSSDADGNFDIHRALLALENLGSAMKGLAVGAAGSVGSALRRKQEPDALGDGHDECSTNEEPGSADA